MKLHEIRNKIDGELEDLSQAEKELWLRVNRAHQKIVVEALDQVYADFGFDHDPKANFNNPSLEWQATTESFFKERMIATDVRLRDQKTLDLSTMLDTDNPENAELAQKLAQKKGSTRAQKMTAALIKVLSNNHLFIGYTNTISGARIKREAVIKTIPKASELGTTRDQRVTLYFDMTKEP